MNKKTYKESRFEKKDGNSFLIMICPKCLKDLPFYTFHIENDKTMIQLHCSCKFPFKPIRIKEYINILKNITLLNSIKPFQLFCLSHQESFFYYCNTCLLSICLKCFNTNHKHHQIITLQRIDINNFLRDYTSLYKQYTIKSNDMINALNKKNNPKDILNTKNQDDLRMQLVINNDLGLLIPLLYSTSIALGNDRSYSFECLCNTIMENITFKSINPNNPNETYLYLKRKYECNGELIGHTSQIMHMIQLNNHLLASCSIDQTIKLWEVSSLECKATLKDNRNKNIISQMIELTNGEIVSSSVNDSIILIWDLSTYKIKARLKGHTSSITYMLQLTNGHLASCSADNNVRIWNIITHKSIPLIAHEERIDLMIQLSNKQLLSISSNKAVLWNINTYQSVTICQVFVRNINCIVQLNDGRLVISASNSKIVHCWNEVSWKCIGIIQEHTSPVNQIVIVKDNLIASCGDCNVVLWNVGAWELKGVLKGHKGRIVKMTLLKNEQLATFSDEDKSIMLWDLNKQDCITTLKGQKRSVRMMLETVEGNLLICSSIKNIIESYAI